MAFLLTQINFAYSLMNKILFIALFASQCFYSQTWVQLPDFPGTKRDDGIGMIIDGKAYFGTGLQEWNLTIDFRVLDLATNSWTSIPTMPLTKERQYACAFPGPQSFYVFGGDGVGGALNTLFVFSVPNNTWTEMAPKPGLGLIGSHAMSFGDKVIITGGKFQDGSINREVWQYTISSDSWVQKGPFPFVPVVRGSAAAVGGKGYLLFGIDSANNYRRELYSYDPTTDQWVALTNFPLPKGRAYAAMQPFGNKLFVFGGIDDQNNFYDDSYYLKLSDFSWIPGPTLPKGGRKGGMSCSLGNDFYYTCGISAQGRLSETWRTDIPVSVHEETMNNAVTLFPNPCHSLLNISFGQLASEENSFINVSNIFGEAVFHQQISPGSVIETSSLEPGIYILELTGGNTHSTVKFVKE
jgi:N-acetylneuraminic acid mutarotase